MRNLRYTLVAAIVLFVSAAQANVLQRLDAGLENAAGAQVVARAAATLVVQSPAVRVVTWGAGQPGAQRFDPGFLFRGPKIAAPAGSEPAAVSPGAHPHAQALASQAAAAATIRTHVTSSSLLA